MGLVFPTLSFSFNQCMLFVQHLSPWFVVLNSRTYLNADGAGRGCLSPSQGYSLVIYSLVVRGSELRVKERDLLSDI